MDAVDAMKENEKVRFLFVGHGSKKAAIEARIKEQNLTNAQMIDFLTGEAFEQAVAISSVCVVSLEKGLRGMCAPSKFYSYLQGGKPIIGIVERGSYIANEIEQRQIGKAIGIGDSEKLRRIISEMANSEEKVKVMGMRSKCVYEGEYTQEIALSKYGKITTFARC